MVYLRANLTSQYKILFSIIGVLNDVSGSLKIRACNYLFRAKMEFLITNKIILSYLTIDDVAMLYFVNTIIHTVVNNRKTLMYFYPLSDKKIIPSSFADHTWYRNGCTTEIYKPPAIDDYLYDMFLKAIKFKDYNTAVSCLKFGCRAAFDTRSLTYSVTLEYFRNCPITCLDVVSSIRRNRHLDSCIEYINNDKHALDGMM